MAFSFCNFRNYLRRWWKDYIWTAQPVWVTISKRARSSRVFHRYNGDLPVPLLKWTERQSSISYKSLLKLGTRNRQNTTAFVFLSLWIIVSSCSALFNSSAWASNWCSKNKDDKTSMISVGYSLAFVTFACSEPIVYCSPLVSFYFNVIRGRFYTRDAWSNLDELT